MRCKESKPDWREAFEQVLAKGGEMSGNRSCQFCTIAGRITEDEPNCDGCVIMPVGGDCCEVVFDAKDIDCSNRRAICRHVLSTVKDFTDREEIRERISEMLDDDAREKFLGKAEKSKAQYTQYLLTHPYTRPKHACECDDGPDLNYGIAQGSPLMADNIILATRDEETRDRVLEFLNSEVKEDLFFG